MSVLPRNERRARRIIIQKPGHYRVFHYDDSPIQDPGPGQVQVEVKVCGINFADTIVHLGLPSMPITAFPFNDVIKAHRSIESGQSVGKLVLVV